MSLGKFACVTVLARCRCPGVGLIWYLKTGRAPLTTSWATTVRSPVQPSLVPQVVGFGGVEVQLVFAWRSE